MSLHLRSRRIGSDEALYELMDLFSTLLARLAQRHKSPPPDSLPRLNNTGLSMLDASSAESGNAGGAAALWTGKPGSQSQNRLNGSDTGTGGMGAGGQAEPYNVTVSSLEVEEEAELWAGKGQGRDTHRHGAIVRQLDSAIAVLRQSAFYPSVRSHSSSVEVSSS